MQLLQSKIPFSQVVPVFFRVFLKGVKWELGFANFWMGKWKFIQNENSGWKMGIGSGTGTPFMTPLYELQKQARKCYFQVQVDIF
jgi:hypothetical protein